MKKHVSFLLSLLILSTLGAGSYDYLGPNRTVSTWVNERKDCYYTADTTYRGAHYGCHLHLYTTPDGACIPAGSTAGYFNASVCGWPGISCTTSGVSCSYGGPSESTIGCSMGETGCRSVQHTTTYPAATILGTVLCSRSGANGWCAGSASLSLSSNEPVAGYNILAIEGTRNGETFACGSPACTVPLVEGQNDFSFWALSSWGDSSAMGSASGWVDSRAPTIDGSLSGVTGSGGWFTSSVTVSASAADPAPGSGLSTLTYSLDGGADTPYGGPLTIGDGFHTITFTATDVAGNSSTSTQTVNVDTGLPVLTIDPISGTSGDNGWYTSDAIQTASAEDPAPGSGLASLTFSLDGGAPEAYTGPIALGDGAHTIVFTATDVAGNSMSETRTVNVDTRAPQLSLDGDDYFCPGCGGTLAVGYSVQDSVSGIASWTLSVDGTTLTSGTAAGSGTFDWDGSALPPGPHTLTLESHDMAGNVAQTTLSVTLVSPTPVPPGGGGGGGGGGGSTVPTNTCLPRTQPGAPDSTPTQTAKVPPNQTSLPTATSKKETSVVAFNPPAPNTSASASSAGSLSTGAPAGSTIAVFGAAAAAIIAAAIAVAVEALRKRKEEENRQATAAATFNAAQIALEEEQKREAAERAEEKNPSTEGGVKGNPLMTGKKVITMVSVIAAMGFMLLSLKDCTRWLNPAQTPTNTSTRTKTQTYLPTRTRTRTRTNTPTSTKTATSTNTATSTITPTATPTFKPAKNISQQGINFIMSWEYIRHELYNDPVNCSIGIGHKVHDGPCALDGSEPSEAPFLNGCDDDCVRNLFTKDLENSIWPINYYVKVPLNQCQFDALVDLEFNTGATWTNPPWLQNLNNGGSSTQFKNDIKEWRIFIYINGQWKKSDNLERRRAAEGTLFGSYNPCIYPTH
jgi:GH24 family phage-related lysozyme (muramidase)